MWCSSSRPRSWRWSSGYPASAPGLGEATQTETAPCPSATARSRAATVSSLTSSQSTQHVRLIPVDATYHVAVGPDYQGGSDLTRDNVAGYYRYFLLPRRPAEAAPWVICYGCDTTVYGSGAKVVWQDDEGVSIVTGAADERAVSRRARGPERALPRQRSRSPLARARLGDLDPTSPGSLGLAYLVGVVVLGSLWTMLLIAGVPFSLGLVLGLPFGARHRGCVVRRPDAVGGQSRRAGTHRRRTDGSLVTAVGIAASGASRWRASFAARASSGLYWWDAWAFWVPKAKVIYFFGSIDAGLFKAASRRGLSAARARCSMRPRSTPWEVADVVTLHVQFWLFGVGFVWALAGLLAEHVSAMDPLAVRAPRPRSRRESGRRFFDHRGGSVSRLPLRAGLRAPLHLAPRSRSAGGSWSGSSLLCGAGPDEARRAPALRGAPGCVTTSRAARERGVACATSRSRA